MLSRWQALFRLILNQVIRQEKYFYTPLLNTNQTVSDPATRLPAVLRAGWQVPFLFS